MFGYSWDVLSSPVEAVVNAIDDDGDNNYSLRIGLSAKQMKNLQINTRSQPLDEQSLLFTMLINQYGLDDGQKFDNVCLMFEGKTVVVHTYNAFGHRALDGNQVRVSRKLANHLGLKVGSRIMLSNAHDDSTSIVPLWVSFLEGMKSFFLIK